jgi:hypothetical protein
MGSNTGINAVDTQEMAGLPANTTAAVNEGDVLDTLATLAVTQGTGKVASEALVDILERYEDIQWQGQVRKAIGCLRIAGCTQLDCNNCGCTINKGTYGRKLQCPWVPGARCLPRFHRLLRV